MFDILQQLLNVCDFITGSKERVKKIMQKPEPLNEFDKLFLDNELELISVMEKQRDLLFQNPEIYNL